MTSKFYISRLIEQAFSQFCFQRENNKLEIVISVSNYPYHAGPKWTVKEADGEFELASSWIHDKAPELTFERFCLEFLMFTRQFFPFNPIIYLNVCQTVEIWRFTPFIQGLFRPFEFNLFNTKIRGYLCPSYTEFKFKWISEKWIKNDTFHVMERGRWYLDLSAVRARFKIGSQRYISSWLGWIPGFWGFLNSVNESSDCRVSKII